MELTRQLRHSRTQSSPRCRTTHLFFVVNFESPQFQSQRTRIPSLLPGGGGGEREAAMGKRKSRDEITQTVSMRAADGDAPFAVYFPSGFDPIAAPCTWHTHAHATRKNQYAVVVETVRRRRRRMLRDASRVARCSKAHTPPPRLAPLQTHSVDFMGTTANAEYSSALPCR